MNPGREAEPARLAELVAALSLGIDLGFGQPMDHVLRQCLIALRLAERIGVEQQQRAVVYYTAMLINVGCHTDAHEQAKWFGDDFALKAAKYAHPFPSVGAALNSVRMLGAGNPPLHRVRVGLEFVLSGHRDLNGMIAHHAARAQALAAQLGLNSDVTEALASGYEQWDGHGWPNGLKGDAVPLAVRLSHVAEYVEVAHRLGGVAAARDMARERAGRQFEPRLAAIVAADGERLFAGLDGTSSWDAVINAEPALRVVLSDDELVAALTAIADFVDLKSPHMTGHSRAVADLVAEAGPCAGLDPVEVRLLHRAALVHDFGRLGVSNSIWDKRSPLGAGEWERVRMYPYLTQRMLSQSRALAPLGAIAAKQRERIDGSGYPGGLSGSAISRSARVLGAADAYQAMREPRPYRDALGPDAAAAQLRVAVKQGTLDAETVEAVLGAAGHRVVRRRAGVASLTGREVEVLRLLARGCSTKEIAHRLFISPKTAANHVAHIYVKIDASTRATAAYFAMRHGLLPDEGFHES